MIQSPNNQNSCIYQEVAWNIFHPLSHKKCDPQHGWTNFPGTSLLDVYIAEIPKRNSSTLINFQEYWGLHKPSLELRNLLAIWTNCWETLLATLSLKDELLRDLLAIWTSHIRTKWRVIPCPRLIFSENRSLTVLNVVKWNLSGSASNDRGRLPWDSGLLETESLVQPQKLRSNSKSSLRRRSPNPNPRIHLPSIW